MKFSRKKFLISFLSLNKGINQMKASNPSFIKIQSLLLKFCLVFTVLFQELINLLNKEEYGTHSNYVLGIIIIKIGIFVLILLMVIGLDYFLKKELQKLKLIENCLIGIIIGIQVISLYGHYYFLSKDPESLIVFLKMNLVLVLS